MKEWVGSMKKPLKKLMGMLNLKLIGHYRYYGISFNGRMISNYKQQVRGLLFKVLNRRSDRKSYTREGFIEMLKYYPLAMPKISSACFETVNIIMKSRMRESRTYGSVRGLHCEV